MTFFACHQCYKISCLPPEPFIYALLHEMNTILRMFVLGHFCCSQECMQNDRDLIHSADTFFYVMARAGFFYQKSRAQHTGIENSS